MNAVERARMRQLDKQLALVDSMVWPQPPRGWVHTMRTALGLTVRQLARRMQRAPSTIAQLEAKESSGTVTLARLQSAASAMDCDVKYILVPRAGSIAATRQTRAETVARRLMHQADTHMRLEDQAVDAERMQERLKEMTAELLGEQSGILWDEP